MFAGTSVTRKLKTGLSDTHHVKVSIQQSIQISNLPAWGRHTTPDCTVIELVGSR